MRTELETGVSDDEWIEVTNRRPPVAPEAPSDSMPWTPIDGTEQVIVGDLSGLTDGAPVEVRPATVGDEIRERDVRPESCARSTTIAGRSPALDTSRPIERLPCMAAQRWPSSCPSLLARLLASGSAGVPPGRRGIALYERRQAADRAAGQAADPDHRPGRRAAQLHPELRAQSSVYPKMNAYISKWIVDIGDRVKKGDALANLFVPELVEDHGTKKATVVLDQERIALAKTVVEVATADVDAAAGAARGGPGGTRRLPRRGRALGLGNQAARQRAQAGRGQSPGCPPDHQSVEGVRRHARRGGGDRLKATAELLSRRAALSQAKVDVRVAEADLTVAESEEKRLQAWVDYLVLPAPYDGVIVARNANTFDFVLAHHGRPLGLSPRTLPLAEWRRPRRSTWSTAPTSSAFSSTSPSKTPITSRSAPRPPCSSRRFDDQPIPGTVTRTSWALNIQSRTLRAEIDLPNPGSQLLPGMYAYAKVIIERPGVRALPVAALDASWRQDHLAGRREVVLLDVRRRPRQTRRGRDRGQRRRVDRGHQSPRSALRRGVRRQ